MSFKSNPFALSVKTWTVSVAKLPGLKKRVAWKWIHSSLRLVFKLWRLGSCGSVWTFWTKMLKLKPVENIKTCQCERTTLIDCNVIFCCNQVPLCFPGCCKAGALCSHFFVAISDVKNLPPADATLSDQGLVSLRLSSFTRHRGAPVVAWKPWNHSAGGLSQQPKWQMPIGAADRITEIRVNRAGSLYQKCHYWCRTYSWCVRLCMTWRVISNWRGFGWLQLVWDVSGHTFIQFSQLPGLSHAALCGPTWAAETCPFSTSRPRAKPPSLGSRSSTRLATKLATPS